MHPGLAAYCETKEKGNKEDIAFITLARSTCTFGKFCKRKTNLKSLGETRWRRLAFPNSLFSRFWHPAAYSAGLGVLGAPNWHLVFSSLSSGLGLLGPLLSLCPN
jgi:hypothetical protein